MKRVLWLIIALLLATGAWWLHGILFPSDETAIRRILHKAAEDASAKSQEGPLDKLSAINRLIGACTADVEISLRLPGTSLPAIQGRDQLREAVGAWRGLAEGSHIDLIDLAVSVDPNQSQATAQFIARSRLDRRSDQMVQEFKVTLNRSEGRWKIRQVEPLVSLRME